MTGRCEKYERLEVESGNRGYLWLYDTLILIYLSKQVQNIPGLTLPVPSDLCIIPMASDGSFDIYVVMCGGGKRIGSMSIWRLFRNDKLGRYNDGEERMVCFYFPRPAVAISMPWHAGWFWARNLIPPHTRYNHISCTTSTSTS